MTTSSPGLLPPARDLERRLSDLPALGSFSKAELEGLPDLVRSYLRRSITPGTPLAVSARFRMRGSIRLGQHWVPFRAREVLAPHHGFVWAARAGGVITGSDRYADGAGAMDWKLLGLFPMMHADGPDVSRSAAGRACAEAVWVPTALLPRFGVIWTATDPHGVTASYQLDETALEVHYSFDNDGWLQSVAFDRWGDPDNVGEWGHHPFGFEVTGYSTFNGITIPSAGRAGWFYRTYRWSEGEFLRAEITGFHLLPSEPIIPRS